MEKKIFGFLVSIGIVFLLNCNLIQNTDKYISILKNSENEADRIEAARKLVIIGTEKAIDGLIFGLDDKNPKVRASVLKYLNLKYSRKIIRPCFEMLKDEDNTVSNYAAGNINSLSFFSKHSYKDDVSRIISELILNSFNSDNKNMLKQIAMLSGDLEIFQAEENLIGLLKNPHHEVKENAIIALGKLNSKQVELRFIDMFGEGNFEIQKAILKSLEKISTEKSIEFLLGLLNSQNIEIIDLAIDVLKNHLSENVIKHYIELFKRASDMTDGGVELQKKIIKNLSYAQSIQAIDFLKHILAFPNNFSDELRAYSAFSMGKIGNENALDVLEEELYRENSNTLKRDIYVALQRIGTENAKRILKKYNNRSEKSRSK